MTSEAHVPATMHLFITCTKRHKKPLHHWRHCHLVEERNTKKMTLLLARKVIVDRVETFKRWGLRTSECAVTSASPRLPRAPPRRVRMHTAHASAGQAVVLATTAAPARRGRACADERDTAVARLPRPLLGPLGHTCPGRACVRAMSSFYLQLAGACFLVSWGTLPGAKHLLPKLWNAVKVDVCGGRCGCSLARVWSSSWSRQASTTCTCILLEARTQDALVNNMSDRRRSTAQSDQKRSRKLDGNASRTWNGTGGCRKKAAQAAWIQGPWSPRSTPRKRQLTMSTPRKAKITHIQCQDTLR